MATVRLDVKTEAALKRLSVRRGQTKSEVIRDAIALLDEGKGEQISAYERLQPFIGISEGGDPKLSENTGKRFRELLENRQRARRSR
jgi:Arc/MetJ-type ribon-helix-helix transcriptional regulator